MITGEPYQQNTLTNSQLSTDWIRIATEIELNYYHFDAFVILHGTDTMGYTSSALSFLLEDLGKTVVGRFHRPGITVELRKGIFLDYHRRPNPAITITQRRGRQPPRCPHDRRPIHHSWYAQAYRVYYSTDMSVSECCLYFNHTLFRGNRVSKDSCDDLDAFSSPNFPPLVNGRHHFPPSEPIN